MRIDSSISKTVNAPKGYAVEQVQKVYERLYRGGAKGGTVYVDGSRDSQVLTLKAEDNTMETSEQLQFSEPVVLVETIQDLRSVNQWYLSRQSKIFAQQVLPLDLRLEIHAQFAAKGM
ncbi:hypothetical protein ACA29_00390 [Lederbergia galactosidilytica]|uniref:Uncharacterized protein n=1 Tax=Lederbergia galactosidilytica TaxID=217031 RepID=A0A0Q9Y8F4_9BACI|nr:hypothetical protein ACA29_00390 [Lederbergia galactosidilytica]